MSRAAGVAHAYAVAAEAARREEGPPQAPPPGERAADELLGAVALAALHDALKDISEGPRVSFKNVKDIEVKRASRWILITVKYRGTRKGDANEVTFRIGRPWAQVLKDRLAKVLE